MISYTLEMREDEEFGGNGWVVVEKHQEGFNTVQIDYGRILAHDMIEHIETGYDPNSDEIVALGAILYNREGDFYNAYGRYGFPDEVVNQLINLYYGGKALAKCYSESPYVRNYLNKDLYKEILTCLREELDDELTLTELRSLFPRQTLIALLSKGYNRMQYLSSRYDFDMSTFFYRLSSCIDSAIAKCEKWQTVKVSWGYQSRDIRVGIIYEDQ